MDNNPLNWVDIIGGHKRSVMWYTDFLGFLVWDYFRSSVYRELQRHISSALTPTVESQSRLTDALKVAKSVFGSIPASIEKADWPHQADKTVPYFTTPDDPIAEFLRRTDQIAADLDDQSRNAFEESFRLFLEKTSRGERNLLYKGRLNVPLLLGTALSVCDHFARNRDASVTRYYAALSIRRRCEMSLDSSSARHVERCSELLNSTLEARKLARLREKRQARTADERPRSRTRSSPTIRLTALQLLKAIGPVLIDPYRSKQDDPVGKYVSGAFLCYLSIIGGVLQPLLGKGINGPAHIGAYHFNGESCDAEYALSMLFGFPLPKTGIDQLFGGGGMFLYDSVDGLSQRSGDSTTLPARIVLARGGFGSGKTSFGLTAAASIAQTGGLAVYFAMEFGFEQALFSLERLGYDGGAAQFRVFNNLKKCLKYFRDRVADSQNQRLAASQGAVLVVSVSQKQATAIDGARLFRLIKLIAKANVPVFPRLIVVDSLNALKRTLLRPIGDTAQPGPGAPNDVLSRHGDDALEMRNQRNDPELRRRVLRELREATINGTNVVLLSEDDDDTWNSFGEDISDTVIRLIGPMEASKATSTGGLGQTSRAINVSKSRYQKEHPGSHPLRIVPGKGLRVFLSTESRAAIDRGRAEVDLDGRRFGAPAIDQLLSDRPVERDCGKVVYLQGQLGTFKTQFGICFLQASWVEEDGNVDRPPAGLFIGMRYDGVDIDKKEEDVFCRSAREPRVAGIGQGTNSAERQLSLPHSTIRTCKLPSGSVFPDEIFQAIQADFDSAAAAGTPIRRVLLDNPGEWEDLCPLLADDPLFAGTLTNFLRKRGVRVLVTNRLIAAMESRLIRAILEQVETSIVLDRKVLAGDSVNTIQVVRSPRMRHNPRLHEIVFKEKLSFRPMESSQFDSEGRIIPAKVQILVRRKSERTRSYWKDVMVLMQATFPSKVEFLETGSFGHRFPFEISVDSVLDCLNIVEIDECELEYAAPSLMKLSGQNPEQFGSRFVEKLKVAESDIIDKVVPFFDNIGCLLYDADAVGLSELNMESGTLSWREIADVAKNYNEERPFFSIPADESENWNCLFLEILASVAPDLFLVGASFRLRDLCSKEPAPAVLTASDIIHCLLHPCFRTTSGVFHKHVFDGYDTSLPNALVSRQWYTTLQQTLREMAKDERRTGRQVGSSDSSMLRDTVAGNYKVRGLPLGWGCSGEWYLGIASGSVAASAGMKLLAYLASPEANMDRLRLGVGLPANRTIESDVSGQLGGYPFSGELFEPTLSSSGGVINRSSIFRYRSCASLLTQTLQKIVCLTRGPSFEDDVQECWRSFIKGLDHVGV